MEEINKQQQMFLSEYCPQEKSTPGKFTYIWPSHRKWINVPEFEKMHLVIFMVRIDSWIIEKVLKFAEQFSSPGESLEKWNKVM